jgi:hypothetical protein
MLLPQENDKYVNTLISMFGNISPIAQKAVITTLWFVSSCKADSFLRSVATNQTFPKEISGYAAKVMSYTKIRKEQEKFIKAIGKEKLAEIRKGSLRRFSDEAIAELDLTTRMLRRENNCH